MSADAGRGTNQRDARSSSPPGLYQEVVLYRRRQSCLRNVRPQFAQAEHLGGDHERPHHIARARARLVAQPERESDAADCHDGIVNLNWAVNQG